MHVVVHILVFPAPDHFVQIQGHLEQQRQNEEERQDQTWTGVFLLRSLNLLNDQVATEVGSNTSLSHHGRNSSHHLQNKYMKVCCDMNFRNRYRQDSDSDCQMANDPELVTIVVVASIVSLSRFTRVYSDAMRRIV